MKKIKFFIICTVVASLCTITVTSCGDDEVTPNNLPEEEVVVVPNGQLNRNTLVVNDVVDNGHFTGDKLRFWLTTIIGHNRKSKKSLYVNGPISIFDPEYFSDGFIIPAYVKLNGKVYPVTDIYPQAFKNFKKMETISFPKTLEVIKVGAFLQCQSLKNFEFPNSLIAIERESFRGCNSLTSVTIPNSVTRIEDGAFRDCSNLKSVVIGNSVASIESYAFENCPNLTSVTIGKSVTSIESYAFFGCKSLSNILIPESVKTIDYNSFSYCTSLTTVTMVSVTSIGNLAFSDCRSLENISIPSSVTSIGYKVFSGCTNMKHITSFNPIPPTVNKSCFEGLSTSKCTLRVPTKSIDAYKTADGWKDFTNIVGF